MMHNMERVLILFIKTASLNYQPFLVLKMSHRSLSFSSFLITNICQLFCNSTFYLPLNSLVVVGFSVFKNTMYEANQKD